MHTLLRMRTVAYEAEFTTPNVFRQTHRNTLKMKKKNSNVEKRGSTSSVNIQTLSGVVRTEPRKRYYHTALHSILSMHRLHSHLFLTVDIHTLHVYPSTLADIQIHNRLKVDKWVDRGDRKRQGDIDRKGVDKNKIALKRSLRAQPVPQMTPLRFLAFVP